MTHDKSTDAYYRATLAEIGGRLDMIECRLGQIESSIDATRTVLVHFGKFFEGLGLGQSADPSKIKSFDDIRDGIKEGISNF